MGARGGQRLRPRLLHSRRRRTAGRSGRGLPLQDRRAHVFSESGSGRSGGPESGRGRLRRAVRVDGRRGRDVRPLAPSGPVRNRRTGSRGGGGGHRPQAAAGFPPRTQVLRHEGHDRGRFLSRTPRVSHRAGQGWGSRLSERGNLGEGQVSSGDRLGPARSINGWRKGDGLPRGRSVRGGGRAGRADDGGPPLDANAQRTLTQGISTRRGGQARRKQDDSQRPGGVEEGGEQKIRCESESGRHLRRVSWHAGWTGARSENPLISKTIPQIAPAIQGTNPRATHLFSLGSLGKTSGPPENPAPGGTEKKGPRPRDGARALENPCGLSFSTFHPEGHPAWAGFSPFRGYR